MESIIFGYLTSQEYLTGGGSVEIKKRIVKKRKTRIRRSRVFQIALKGGQNENVTWENSDYSVFFVILKIIFSRHRLIKISMTCVYVKPEVKKRYNSNDCRYKWSLHRVITWKLLCDRNLITLLITENVNLLRRTFLVGKMSNLLGVGWDSPLYPGFFIKTQGDNDVQF